MRIHIPKQAIAIIDKLQEHGFHAYIVGGCVRDSIMGRQPADWDITTSATPMQVKSLFTRTVDTGLKHGTVTILMDKEAYEVTTYRTGQVYNPDQPEISASFAETLEEDLSYRDFTINAMAYNDQEGLIDPFDGMTDLKHRIIRCVGTPSDRFKEDPLRMLRAIRFSGRFGFEIDLATRQAIKELHTSLARSSAERIQTELVKLLTSDHPDQIRDAYETGLTSVFLPEFNAMMVTMQNNPHHIYTVGEHTIHALSYVEADPVLRLAVLLHDIGKPSCKTTDTQGIDHFYHHDEVGMEMSKHILKRLKFDNKTIQTVSTLVSFHDNRFSDPKITGRVHVRQIMSQIGAPLFPYLLKVMEADVKAQSSYLQQMKLSILAETTEAMEEILSAKDCLSLKELSINGEQLKTHLGIQEGKMIGTILNTLLAIVLEHPELNRFFYLKELATRIYNQLKSQA